MSSASQIGRVVLGEPTLQNTSDRLTATIFILNGGDAALEDLVCSSVELRNLQDFSIVPTLSPPAAPLPLGDLFSGNVASLVAIFPNAALPAGARALLTVRATYVLGGERLGLTLTRVLTVPEAAPSAFPTLDARVEAEHVSGTWRYVLFNDEPTGASQHIAAFALDLSSPFSVTGTPPGWRYETDNTSYLLWVSEDVVTPYGSHVAPGESLAGFSLTASAASSEISRSTLNAWDHEADDAGLTRSEYVLVPRRG